MFKYICQFCGEKLMCKNNINNTTIQCPNCYKEITPTYKKKIYVCSPYRGQVDLNKWHAATYCKEIVKAGNIPIAPHLYFPQFLDDDKQEDRQLGISCGIELLKECDEMWVFGKPTQGMLQEIEVAKNLKIKIIQY